MAALVVTATEMRRYLRDRTAMFFVVVLSVLIIVILGVTVTGEDRIRVAVVDADHSALAARLVTALRSSSALKVDQLADADEARTGVRRGEDAVALVIEAGYCGPEATTVIDLTSGSPALVRAGRGDLSPFGLERE